METVDMAKIMGINYFRQLDSMRLGTNSNQTRSINHPAELLPREIVKILFNQRHSHCVDWFTKKAFTKPFKVLEKQQTVQERKEILNRGADLLIRGATENYGPGEVDADKPVS